VNLTAEQKARIQESVLDKMNKVAACQYSDINVRTFDKAMNGETALKNTQVNALIKFCDIVEGKTDNEA
jgi:hypothetical protein